jgi:RNA polymerase sigma factor (sigma-70 family)
MPKNKTKKKGKKRLPCGACMLVNILAGDLSIVRVYMNVMMFKRGWFKNISRLDGRKSSRVLEDVSQEAYMAIFTKYVQGSLSEIRHFKSYLWAIVRNICIREEILLKRSISMNLIQAHIENDVFARSTDENVVSKCIKKEQLELIHKAVAELDPFERFLVCLRYKKDLQCSEIAEIIGETRNYVNVMLFHVRKKIKAKLEKLIQEWQDLDDPDTQPPLQSDG